MFFCGAVFEKKNDANVGSTIETKIMIIAIFKYVLVFEV